MLHNGRDRLRAAFLTTILTTGLMTAAPLTAAAGNTAGAAPAAGRTPGQVAGATATTEASAGRAARTSGHRVEALSLRTETRQVFANPDGTWTADITAQPRWVRRGADWVAVDTHLRTRADGRLATTATPLELSFSPGGDTDLATIGSATSGSAGSAGSGAAGHSVGMTWPAPLPTPIVDGSTARYPEVLPGVDLEVTAGATGFSEVLLVKTAAAARQPALAALRFGLKTSGVTVAADGHGGAHAVDAAGNELFHAPTPQMWDSSVAGALRSASVPGTAGAARHRAMATTVAADAITVRPDTALLTGPDTVYPVYLDPQWSGARLAWTYVDKAYPTTSYWNSTETPAVGTYNGGSTVKRSYWRMDTSAVSGRHILGATFRIKENWAYSCTAAPVDLYLTNGISSSTNWNTKPANVQKLGTVTTAKGWSSSCPAGDIEFDATSTIVSQAAAGAAYTTLSLQASETDSYGWKRFDNTPHLVVDYNSVPNAPTAYGTQPGTPCVTGTARPALNTTTPKLYANVYDPDGSNDDVRAEFELRHWDTATATWQNVGSPLVTAYVAVTSPTTLTVTTPTLTDGHIYSWHTRAFDGTDASAWTGWCEFTVDTQAPAQLPTVTSTDYPAGSSFPDAHGSPGLPGTFTLGSGGAYGVTSFRWALNDTSVANTNQAAATGGTATVQITPVRDQQNTLYVWPVDSAGNVGTRYASYDFFVAFASGPVGRWRADENTGTTSADDSGRGHPVTWTGAGWTGDGRDGAAVTLNGSSAYGATSGSVVRTDRSLSVSAWARLTSTAHVSTVVSQSGSRQSGFQLYYSSSLNKWAFNRYVSDTDGASFVRAASDAPAVVGAWTHLVGVYDAPRQQVRLYVNGVLQSTPGTFTTPWSATGPLQVGRVLGNGSYVDHFAGDLDEVRVYDRILLDQAGCDPVADDQIPACQHGIHQLATRPGTTRGAWALDETAGTVAVDSSGAGRNATLVGGTTWDVDGSRGGALNLDGTSGYAATAGPVLRTDGSFTVSAWVRVGAADSVTLPTRNLTAVGQDGTNSSPFYLGYRRFTDNGVTSGYWSFSAVSADATSGYTWRHARSDPIHAPAPGAWSHLAGVYDAPLHELRLYVGGELVARTTGVTTWQANGALTIGAARWSGTPRDLWEGALDDVRAYAGTLTDYEIFVLSTT